MEMMPMIFTAKVMHKRLFPKVNAFTYGVYYLVLPLSKLYSPETINNLAVNRFGMLSFYEKDHGDRKGKIEDWMRNILANHSLNEITKEIVLISMPRVIGYVFNPVSFWLCFDKDKNIRAVLCEVNNTFDEKHSYLCSNAGKIIKPEELLKAQKVFHVSPFLKREGSYTFRFSIQKNKMGIWIDFYNKEGKKKLVTSVIGNLEPLTKSTLKKAFFKHPLVTLKTIFLIHWQALKLITKGIKYISRPKQFKSKFTKTDQITGI
jgi:uncharacterized protein